MLAGGLFLIYKATKKIHHKLEGQDDNIRGGFCLTKRTPHHHIAVTPVRIRSVVTATPTSRGAHPAVGIQDVTGD